MYSYALACFATNPVHVLIFSSPVLFDIRRVTISISLTFYAFCLSLVILIRSFLTKFSYFNKHICHRLIPGVITTPISSLMNGYLTPFLSGSSSAETENKAMRVSCTQKATFFPSLSWF